MANYETFSHTVDDYAAELTSHSHQTLYWLHRHGYLTDEDTIELLSRMVVVPIRNSPKFGQRLLARFFGSDSGSNSFSFPITVVDDLQKVEDESEVLPKGKGKPKLTVVE